MTPGSGNDNMLILGFAILIIVRFIVTSQAALLLKGALVC
jgi:hypothetical protein